MARKKIKKYSVVELPPAVGSISDTINVADKVNNAPSINLVQNMTGIPQNGVIYYDGEAIPEGYEEVDISKDIIIEQHTLQLGVSFPANTTKNFYVPDKDGYKAYPVKPFVNGAYSDLYAVYVPFYTTNAFAIRNVANATYTWDIYCVVMYVKQ